MKRLKNLLLLLMAVPVIAFASEEGPALDKAPVNLADHESLQRGARIFVNYCLNCHSAAAMRYSRMEWTRKRPRAGLAPPRPISA
jgi:ubiquinol-cytochrome c reductase cytochrome c1 subunit